MTDLLIGAAVIVVLTLPGFALGAGLYWLVDAIDMRLYLARLKKEEKRLP